MSKKGILALILGQAQTSAKGRDTEVDVPNSELTNK